MRRLLLSALISFFFTAIFCQNDLENGLVAYFPFAGNAEDSSTYENDAIFINDAMLISGVGRDFEGAYYFDGDNDYIEIPHQTQLDFGDTTDEFTLSIWVKPDAIQSDSGSTVNDFLGKWNSLASEQGYYFGLRYINQTSEEDAGKISFVRYDGPATSGCGNAIFLNSTEKITNEGWHHIVVTRTSDGIIELFFNGRSQGTVQDNSVCNIDNMENITLGVRTLNLDVNQRRSFQGGLDEFRIYNRVLSSNEVSLLYLDVMVSVRDFLTENEISIYPNPLKGENFQLINKTGSDLNKIEIFDLLGKKQGESFNNQLPQLQGGTYVFVFHLRDGRLARQKVQVLRP